MSVKIGMAKQDLAAAKDRSWILSDERVCAVALYAESEDTKAIWMVLDFMDFNLSVVNALKEAVAAATGLAASQVHILTTHNHGAGVDHALEKLSPLCATCALQAIASARPATMSMAITNIEKQITYIRRIYVPEIDAATTLFYGTCEENGFDSAPHTEFILNELAEGRLNYRGYTDTDRPYKPFPKGDPCLFAAVFRDENDQVIGSLVRFATHVICTYTDGIASGDFPHYLRKELEETLGGTAMFLNGPCGNIAPGFKSREGLSPRIGHYLAQEALKALKDQPQVPLTKFQDTALTISLPVDKDILTRSVDYPAEMPEDFPSRIRYLEAFRRADEDMDFLQEKYRVGETTLKDTIDVSVGILQLNDLTVVGFPGETFYETGEAVRQAFPDKDIITATEHGRTVMYMPVKEQMPLGGYETVCRVTAPGAAEIMEDAVKAKLKQLL